MLAASTNNPRTTPSKNILNLQQALKLALSLVLFYWLALKVNWDLPNNGALAIVIVSLGTRGASIEKGIARVIGTTFGVAIGFLILGLFHYDRWATLCAFAVYLTVIGYCMQGSQNSYAWFVAGFVPLVIWGDNYPHFDNAFYFGTYRWLETTTGVVIYTLVDLLLWPRHAGDQLNQQGQSLWSEVAELYAGYRGELTRGEVSEGPERTSAMRSKVAGTLAGADATLQQAYLDTPTINARKRVWQAWHHSTAAMLNALELWRECIDDCRHLDLQRLVPRLDHTLQELEARIEAMRVQWHSCFVVSEAAGFDDRELLEPLDLEIDDAARADLSRFERAALLCFIRQLQTIDRTSRRVLHAVRALADLDPGNVMEDPSDHGQLAQSTSWSPERLVYALFPVVAFATAFLFWIFWDPPTGSKVPMFAGIIALVVLRTPMNPIPLLVVLILSIFFTVAPVYWLVMPTLETGFGLLCLVFAYSLLFGYLGGIKPILKAGPMIMFVNMSGISNEQSYSFQGPVGGALMTLMGGSFVALAYMLFSPLRPEQALLFWLRRFFDGCAQVTREWDPQDSNYGDRRRANRRRRVIESMVLPAPSKILSARQRLEFGLYADNLSDEIQRLHDCVQNTAYRLESLNLAAEQVASQSPNLRNLLAPLSQQVWAMVGDTGQRLTAREPSDEFTADRESFERVCRDLNEQIDQLETDSDQGPPSDDALVNLYAVLGNARGLIEAMASTRNAMARIDWRQMARPRF